jgi:lysylphosphatidylglycerol synthetase-like protein (DUF2156 family)
VDGVEDAADVTPDELEILAAASEPDLEVDLIEPQTATGVVGLRRIRRVVALVIAAAGAVNLVSAVTPPLGSRLRFLRSFIPLEVPQAAAALVALAGMGLLLLSSGLRRGQRRAWLLSVVLLSLSAVLHLVKGGDLEESVAAAVAAGLLVRHRNAFRAAPRVEPARPALSLLVCVGAVAALAGTITVRLSPEPGAALSPWRALLAVLERLVGIDTIAVSDRAGDFLDPVLGTLGFGLALGAAWVVLRPLRARRRAAADVDRARALVHRNPGDTLAYFALRND